MCGALLPRTHAYLHGMVLRYAQVLSSTFFLEYAVAKCMLLQGVVLGVAEENCE